MSIFSHEWGKSVGADQVWAEVCGLPPASASSHILMVLQAYIDESYQPDGVFVLGGFVASAKSWAEFSKEWEQCLPNFGVLDAKSNTYHFKYSDMAHLPERRERIKVFEKIVERHALFGLFCKFNVVDLRSAISRIHVPSLSYVDFGDFVNPYLLAYRCLMDMFHIHRRFYKEIIPQNEPIDFFFDEQLGEKRVIIESWESYIESRPDELRALYGQTPSFRDDKKFLPLQAADLLAGLVRESYVKNTFDDKFSRSPTDKRSFPILGITFDEDDLLRDFKKIIRQHTDAQIFDVKIGEIR